MRQISTNVNLRKNSVNSSIQDHAPKFPLPLPLTLAGISASFQDVKI